MAICTRRVVAAAVAAVFLLAPAEALAAADISVRVTADRSRLPLGGPETTTVTVAVAKRGRIPPRR